MNNDTPGDDIIPDLDPADYRGCDYGDDGYTKPIQVVLFCNKTVVNEDTVEFQDISEDIQGHDILTFKCPACGETHQSKRLG